MKITVIGACGRTGLLVCNEALARGHEVVGLARSDCNISGINLVIGDASNSVDLQKALAGADIVISVIGHVKLKEQLTQTEAIKQIIKISTENNINKIVSLTGTGVRIEGDKISIIDKILNYTLYVIDKDRIIDGRLHATVLQESGLKYVLLRVLKLSNNNKLQKYEITKSGPAKTLVSRSTVAKALVDIAESDNWDNTSPILSRT